MSGTWHPLVNQPTFNASTMLLLTDGTVMCQQNGGINWWRLRPSLSGKYIDGHWSPLAPMHHTRLYYASAVLKDGRVFVAGGEYSDAGSETNTAEIYNPVTDTWKVIASPPGWARIGDAACCVLPNGTVMLGNLDDTRTAIYHPSTNTWSAGPPKGDRSSEETWTLLPDGTILSPQCTSHPHAEKYNPGTNSWVSAGTTPVDLVEASSIEIGPALLMYDGHTFCIGATGHTAIYHKPAVPGDPGTWTKGPDFPSIGGKRLGAKDAPGCLLVNGKVLCVAGPVDGVSGDYLAPTYFFEFDGTHLTQITAPMNSGGVPYNGRMLLLPTGEVLFSAATHAIYLYMPGGKIMDAWRPVITGYPTLIRPGFTYTLHGKQINGLSQACSYGDDASMATNYPIIRLRHVGTGETHYARTFDHSTMAVATGPTVHHTNFTVPLSMPTGPTEIVVIANGIPSHVVEAHCESFFLHIPPNEEAWARLIGSLADGPLWVLGPNGPIPVDPWGPKVAREAEAARAQVLNGIRTLQKLGKEVETNREEIANQVAPAVDPADATVKSEAFVS